MSQGFRIDCKKVEDNGEYDCRNCGRPLKFNYKTGKVEHKRGWRRRWPDPRKGTK